MAGGSAPGVIVADDFESTAVGAIPADFTKTGEIGVAEGVAHSGKHALQVEHSVRGGRFINLAPDKVAALGGEHWGRFYFKVKTPAPMPTGRLIHITLVDGKAVSPLAKDVVDVRLATLLYYPTGEFNYYYNVPAAEPAPGIRTQIHHPAEIRRQLESDGVACRCRDTDLCVFPQRPTTSPSARTGSVRCRGVQVALSEGGWRAGRWPLLAAGGRDDL